MIGVDRVVGPDGRVAVGAAQVRAGGEDGVPREASATRCSSASTSRPSPAWRTSRRCSTLPDVAELDGIVLGRVDMSGSLGLTREDINSDAVYAIAQNVVHAGQGARPRVRARRRRVGGLARLHAPSARGAPRPLRDAQGRLRLPGALGDDAETGILKAVGFELMWLKNKRDFYGCIFEEDHARIDDAAEPLRPADRAGRRPVRMNGPHARW